MGWVTKTATIGIVFTDTRDQRRIVSAQYMLTALLNGDLDAIDPLYYRSDWAKISACIAQQLYAEKMGWTE